MRVVIGVDDKRADVDIDGVRQDRSQTPVVIGVVRSATVE